jgi:hypothetical protein
MVVGRDVAERLGMTMRTSKGLRVEYANQTHGWLKETVTGRVQVGTYNQTWEFWVGDIGDEVILGLPFFNSVQITNLSWHLRMLEFRVLTTNSTHRWQGANRPSMQQQVWKVVTREEILGDEEHSQETTEIFQIDIKLAVTKDKQTEQLRDIELHDQLRKAANGNVQMEAVLLDYIDRFRPPTEPPISRPEDMEINFLPDAKMPPWVESRKLNEEELVALKEKITELLEKKYIVPSTSTFGANVLFTKKHDGSLRLCIDYRRLNLITIRYHAPIPDIELLREQLRDSTIYSKFDLRDGYYNIRMKKGHESKTAFKCRYGLYEWTVVPFGLTNAPAVFCAMMNRIFGPLLDVCIIAYMDDILCTQRGSRNI